MSHPKVQRNLTLPRIDVDNIKDVMDINNIKLSCLLLRGFCVVVTLRHVSVLLLLRGELYAGERSLYGCGDSVLLQLHVLGGHRLLTCSVRRLKSKMTRVSGTTEGSVKLAQVHVK